MSMTATWSICTPTTSSCKRAPPASSPPSPAIASEDAARYARGERRLGQGGSAAGRRRCRRRRRRRACSKAPIRTCAQRWQSSRGAHALAGWELETVNDPTGRTGKMTEPHSNWLLLASSMLASAGYAARRGQDAHHRKLAQRRPAIWQEKIIPAFEAKNPGIKVEFAPTGADRIQRRARTPSSKPARPAT